jgi:glucose-6-phosphate isomerase
MFEFWDWVGGRYSLWSAIGLPIVMMIGMDNFKKLLAGAHEMDKHFQNAPLEQNMPVLLGLIGIWYNNFFENAQSHAVLPYDFALELLPAYLQQLVMESLGKRISRDGEVVDYATCPIVWGAPGNNGQHAFYQLLHQGTHIVPADFIITVENVYDKDAHEIANLSNALAQTDALMNGRSAETTQKMLQDNGDTAEEIALQLPHRTFIGNKPSNVLVYQHLNPETLGALLALYEHKTFVQGVCWNLNPFDQWGVELGKQVANNLLPDLEGKTHHIGADDAISGLLNYIKAKR